MLCECCNKEESVGVFSTSAPISCAFCQTCIDNGVTDPLSVFKTHYIIYENNLQAVHPDYDKLKTYIDGLYVYYSDWVLLQDPVDYSKLTNFEKYIKRERGTYNDPSNTENI